eukprot:TRINITY_DN3716_c1_g1_i1.p1 TRINITY_DN3716_c1_g1~~TRINITY_DN3716_c1_g1_i1.p1  ORF type:complete len:331 (+),score=37.30 TRINITY_DN3716_c1_g1_i1:89-994(+)
MNLKPFLLLVLVGVAYTQTERSLEPFRLTLNMPSSKRNVASTLAFNPDMHNVSDLKWNENVTNMCLGMRCPCDMFLNVFDSCVKILTHSGNYDIPVDLNGFYDGADCTYYNATCDVYSEPRHQIKEEYLLLPCSRLMKVESIYRYEFNNDTKEWGKELRSSNVLHEGEAQTVLSEPHITEKTNGFHENLTFWFKDLPVPIEESRTGAFQNSFHVLLHLQYIEYSGEIDNAKAPVWLQVDWREHMNECSSCWGGVGCLGNRTTVFMIISLLVSFTALLISTVWHCTAVAAAKQGIPPPTTAN